VKEEAELNKTAMRKVISREHTSFMPGISMSGISSIVQQYDSFFTKLPSKSWYAQNSSSSYTSSKLL